jgi:ribosomal protein S18 acetylase RimI-like enzyme
VVLTFRTADNGDIAELTALIESAYRGDESRQGWTTEADLLDGQRTDADELGEIVAGAGRQMLLAVRDGLTVGCCQLRCLPGRSAYLGMLAVRPGLQAGGLGRAIVTHAEGLAVALCDATSMRMTVLRQRQELIAWYERLGYRPTGETEPFPYDRPRWGVPRVAGLGFVVLAKPLC